MSIGIKDMLDIDCTEYWYDKRADDLLNNDDTRAQKRCSFSNLRSGSLFDQRTCRLICGLAQLPRHPQSVQLGDTTSTLAGAE